MKNKYLTKYFCITMISAAVLTASVSVSGAETGTKGTVQSGEAADYAASLSGTSAEDGTAAQSDLASETTASLTSESVVPTAAPSEPAAVPMTVPAEPTAVPTTAPSEPAAAPTAAPTEPTAAPVNPSVTPTAAPSEPTVTPTAVPSDSTVTPTVTPAVTPTAVPTNPTITPSEPTVTPTAVPEPTKIPEKIQKIIDRIDTLSLTELTISSEKEIKSVRKAYDALSEAEKKLITNYNLFVSMEEELAEITKKDTEPTEDPDSLVPDDQPSAVNGDPLYVTDMVSNLHAGKDFYLNSLSDSYHLTFSDDFAAVMEEIEKEYKAANNLSDASDSTGVTSSQDTYLVRNWQDILAVYVYRQSLAGKESFTLDSSCKAELAEIFAEMNPLIADETDPSKLVYANYHINYYIKAHGIAKEDREILKKYTETDCSLLCAVVTGARGFVRQSVGDDVSEERVNVVTAAYSLIGKVGYFWGGKYASIGENPSWGTVMQVTAEGSSSTGTLRAYGLDCSGFVTWSVINGYQNTGMQSAIGDGTTDQWLKAEVISESDARPGDLVFQAGPEAGVNNHVGIICGKTDSGDWIVVHCSSGQNGVTVGEAYGAGFRYIRRPTVYAAAESLSGFEESNTVDVTFLESLTVENSLAGLQESEIVESADPADLVGPVFTGTGSDGSTAAVSDTESSVTGNDDTDGSADAHAGQTAQTQGGENLKQTLSEITVTNALASLKSGSSQTQSLSEASAVPEAAASGAAAVPETAAVSGTVAVSEASSQSSAIPQITAQNALKSLLCSGSKAGTAQTAAVFAAEESVQGEEASARSVSYTAAGSPGDTPVSGIRVSNALLSIRR